MKIKTMFISLLLLGVGGQTAWAGCEQLANTHFKGKVYNSSSALDLDIQVSNLFVKSYHQGGAVYILNGTMNNKKFKFSTTCSDRDGQIQYISFITDDMDFYSSFIEAKRINVYGNDRVNAPFNQYSGFIESAS